MQRHGRLAQTKRRLDELLERYRVNTPERIYNVSQTQLSVARFYGGCSLNGADYHYDAESDTLVRMDVWKAQCASSKKESAKAAKAEREKQQSFAEFSNA